MLFKSKLNRVKSKNGVAFFIRSIKIGYMDLKRKNRQRSTLPLHK